MNQQNLLSAKVAQTPWLSRCNVRKNKVRVRFAHLGIVTLRANRGCMLEYERHHENYGQLFYGISSFYGVSSFHGIQVHRRHAIYGKRSENGVR